ncbi:MAG: hypothetical protein Q4F72_04455 [Desulfovibrionaceae bacterium]|nr:hypothetical protein [Desulfovibrionaceae bacterium]
MHSVTAAKACNIMMFNTGLSAFAKMIAARAGLAGSRKGGIARASEKFREQGGHELAGY